MSKESIVKKEQELHIFNKGWVEFKKQGPGAYIEIIDTNNADMTVEDLVQILQKEFPGVPLKEINILANRRDRLYVEKKVNKNFYNYGGAEYNK